MKRAEIPLTTDLLNNSASFLNLSFNTNANDRTRLSFLTTINNVNDSRNFKEKDKEKESSRSNTTNKKPDKENISPIKKTAKNKLLQQISSTNHINYSNRLNTNYMNNPNLKNLRQKSPFEITRTSLETNKTLFKRHESTRRTRCEISLHFPNNVNNNSNNPAESFMSEEEKLLNVNKKLENDLNNAVSKYECLQAKLFTQRKYLEKRQKNLMKELEEAISEHEKPILNQIFFEESGEIALQAQSNKFFLLQNQEKIVNLFKNLLNNIGDNNAEAAVLQTAYMGIYQEKSSIISSLFHEECELKLLKEQRAMLIEDFNSKNVQSIELAFEYEDIEAMLDEIKSFFPQESEVIAKELEFQTKKDAFSEEIKNSKEKIQVLEGGKEKFENSLAKLQRDLEKVKENLVKMREIKNMNKIKVKEFNARKSSLMQSLDELAKESFNKYFNLFNEQIFEEIKDLDSTKLYFKGTELIIQELFGLFNEKKSPFSIEIKADFIEKLQNLAQNSFIYLKTIFFTNEEVFWNLISGSFDPNNSLNYLELLKDLHEHYENTWPNIQELKALTVFYENLSTRLLSEKSEYSSILKELSLNRISLNESKTSLKELEKSHEELMSTHNMSFQEGVHEMMECFLKDHEEKFKELKFTYGKEYVKKYQFHLEREFRDRNRFHETHFKTKVLALLDRRNQVQKQRNSCLQSIEREIRSEIQRKVDCESEINEKIRFLKDKLQQILMKEKLLLQKTQSFYEQKHLQKPEINQELEKYRAEIKEFLSQKEEDIPPLMKKRLLKEKIQGLKQELDNFNRTEMPILEEMEKELGIQANLVEEKKQRVQIMKDYMKSKEISLNTNKNNNNCCNSLGTSGLSTTINSSILKKTEREKDLDCKNERKLEKKHYNSKSFMSFPAKFGLVTINLGENSNFLERLAGAGVAVLWKKGSNSYKRLMKLNKNNESICIYKENFEKDAEFPLQAVISFHITQSKKREKSCLELNKSKIPNNYTGFSIEVESLGLLEIALAGDDCENKRLLKDFQSFFCNLKNCVDKKIFVNN